MRITKNTLLWLVLSLLLLFFIYYYGYTFVDNVLKGKVYPNELLGIEISGWILASFTFCSGLFIGWLFFRR